MRADAPELKFSVLRGRGLLSPSAPLRRRLQYCQSMDFHFLADALQIFVVMRDRATLNDLADTRSFYHRIGDANFVDIGGTLVRAPQYSRPVRNNRSGH